MTEPDRPHRGPSQSEADQTLLGVAPPRIDSSVGPAQRSPVFVRSGTSVADAEPAPLPRVALPSRPPPPETARTEAASFARPPHPLSALRAKLEPAFVYSRSHLVLAMVLAPVLFALCLIALTRHASTHARRLDATHAAALERAVPSTPATAEPPKVATLAELEQRAPGSLSAREVVLVAEGHARQKRAAASALREKIERDPALRKDPGTETELLGLAADPAAAPDALAAMAALESPIGADLLYEVWTATPVRSDTTDLARALLYSADVRPKASAALAVALALRVAESCEQYQAILPKALTDGDRRSQHLLAKLNGKRGCGPKKNEDCYACLRSKSDELSATINAVKSRRPPSFSSP